MIPVPDLPMLSPAAFDGARTFAGVATPATPTPHDPTGLELGMGALMRFKALMAGAGQDVQLARMCYDRLYAYERFAQAHASGDEPLQRLALELFQIYHRRSAAGRAPQ